MSSTKTSIEIEDALRMFHPFKSIIAYKFESDKKFYMESADISAGKAGAYAPMSFAEIKSIFAHVNAAENGLVTSKGLMPSNVLHLNIIAGDYRLVWWQKAATKLIKFDKECKLPNMLCKMPQLVYDASRRDLKVFAVKKKPKMMTELYKAPFFNIFEDGRVCTGNVKINIPRIVDIREIMQIWEKIFWQSEFTDVADTSSKKYWKQLVKKKQKVYLKTWLTRYSKMKTLKKLINRE